MRVVTRFDNVAAEYVVEVEWPDRDPVVERYTDYGLFNDRVQRLQIELVESQWQQSGTPEVMGDGWRGPLSRE
jgi:hypothetical protein